MVLDAVSSNDQIVRGARLSAYSRVLTRDLDDAAESIGRIFCPHALAPLHRSARDFHALHNSAVFDGFSINYVAYGGSVAIDPGCLDRFFLMQIPLRGNARIRTGGREVLVAPARAASLLSPTLPTQMVWQNDCAKLILLVDRGRVEARAAAMADKAARPIEFDPMIDLGSPFGRALQAQVAYLADIAEQCGPTQVLSPVVVATLRESVIGLLLTGHRHNLSEAIARAGEHRHHHQHLPGSLRKAREYLTAHAAGPLDLERLAQHSGAGIRSLQLGFRRHFGLSISEMLLDIRLDQLRSRLVSAAPGERITDIAFDLGFGHLGRMAALYRGKFGERPSQTLRNR